ASADSTERVTMWMDRATVVLIGAVCATTAVFDGKDIADPARLIGVGAGVLASILRVPMLLAVMIGMAVCAIIRTTGMLRGVRCSDGTIEGTPAERHAVDSTASE